MAWCMSQSSPCDKLTDLHCGRADTCGTMYGEQTGEVVQTTATATAAECCTACKGSTQCNTWNYCYCNRGCGNNPKGTCLLKNQTNPFYPRYCWGLLQGFSYVIVSSVEDLHIQWASIGRSAQRLFVSSIEGVNCVPFHMPQEVLKLPGHVGTWQLFNVKTMSAAVYC